ncbi:MAG TPA: cysteine dioxygenase [Phenylobacterium sp.]
MSPPNLARLRAFVIRLAALVEAASDDEERVLRVGAALLRELVSTDDWLPAACSAADPARYRQYLLHCDSRERFSVASFVWGPGQATPIHDHTVWGLVGVLRGAEISQAYGRAGGDLVPVGPARRLEAGEVDVISPGLGDIHRVANARDDRPSVSIHVYGGNIGAIRRSTFDRQGRPSPFVSGYANADLPNLWGASQEQNA